MIVNGLNLGRSLLFRDIKKLIHDNAFRKKEVSEFVSIETEHNELKSDCAQEYCLPSDNRHDYTYDDYRKSDFRFHGRVVEFKPIHFDILLFENFGSSTKRHFACVFLAKKQVQLLWVFVILRHKQVSSRHARSNGHHARYHLRGNGPWRGFYESL
jgi:hypothetical protein